MPTTEFRLAVTGGRNYSNKQAVFKALDAVNNKRQITLLIHGAAKGADTLSSLWAKERNIPQQAFYANWDKHGKSAGSIRNREMLESGKPQGLIAFPGGKGTANMIKESKLRHITIYQPYPSTQGDLHGKPCIKCRHTHRITSQRPG